MGCGLAREMIGTYPLGAGWHGEEMEWIGRRYVLSIARYCFCVGKYLGLTLQGV